MKHNLTIATLILLKLLLPAAAANALDIRQYPALTELVDTMVNEDGFPRAELEAILTSSRVDQKTIDLMNRQYEALPWHRYRDLFINQARIEKGVSFWQEHKDLLQTAEEAYGVPQEIMVALIGVETHYGTRMGDRRVLDSLVTLTADYPRRSEFFGSELRTFLNTTRAEGIAPDSVLGSYAGAIGIPQFMPTSYEAYAVDFNNNGRRDLVGEMEDAVGSVANYLSVHGWRRDQAIFAPVIDSLPASATELVSRRAKLAHNVADLVDAGVKFDQRGAGDRASLFYLTQESGKTYVVGFRNFYAITRYNPSVNYAMAVTELSELIRERAGKQ